MVEQTENESAILKRILLKISGGAVRAWRNQVGRYKVGDRWISYGICNPGGSDIIGLRSVVITEDMVGHRVAVFVAIEAKSASGTLKRPQKLFLDFVKKMGGIAGVARSPSEAEALINSHISGIGPGKFPGEKA